MATPNSLAELSHLARTLNEQTDAYTESLTKLEKKLREMNLGVEAWVPLKDTRMSGTPDRDTSIRTILGYAKTSDGWGFATQDLRLESGFFEGDESCPWTNEYEIDQPKLLLKGSRELRILAARRIGDLLNALKSAAEDAVKSLCEARLVTEQNINTD
jgi:hypothetical protein